MCGKHHSLPDGTPAECEPFGEHPCCNQNGRCGNKAEDCTCDICTDYRLGKWRGDRKCGGKHPLLDGTPAECNPYGEYPCCNQWGECGNRLTDCTCETCTDYRLVRWGDDGRCGSDYPLPDGTPAECDPGGLYPCCNQWGRCGGRTEDCNCETCTDYRLRKWRVDGRCGSKYPLWDGTPSECEPEGGYPCCPNTSGGRCQKLVLDYCNCKHSPGDCVNYRAVQNIRKSGKSCAVTNVGGFLKYVCFDEDTRHFYYKCVYSEVYYQVNYTGSELLGVSEVCDEDNYAYQACGFNTNLTIDTIVFCGGYFCEQKLKDGLHKYVKCSGIDCGYCKRSLDLNRTWINW